MDIKSELEKIKKFANTILQTPGMQVLELKLAGDLNCSILFYERLKECENKIDKD